MGGQQVDIELITYSFPCQDISSAGLQRGLKEGSGSRSSLLWECAKAIDAKYPKYLVMENVKALLQNKFKKDFQKWIDWLSERGYTNYIQVLDAQNYGVPQHRERVFMVSIRGEHDPYEFPAPEPLTLTLGDLLENDVDDKYYLSEKALQGCLSHFRGKYAQYPPIKPTPLDSVCPTLTACGLYKGNSGGVYVAQPRKSIVSPQHGYFKGSVRTRVAPTVKSSAYTSQSVVYTIDDGLRRLTPREAFRFMDVSEEDIDKLLSSGISKTQLLKMAGNSIVVSCLEKIFENLFIPKKLRKP